MYLHRVAGGTDYVVYDTLVAAPNDVEYVTVGAKLGYYALPDPIYHPNYNAGGSWALTTGFTWNWTAPTAPAAPTITQSGDCQLC